MIDVNNIENSEPILSFEKEKKKGLLNFIKRNPSMSFYSLCSILTASAMTFPFIFAEGRDDFMKWQDSLPHKIFNVGKENNFSVESLREVIESKDKPLDFVWNNIENGDIVVFLKSTPGNAALVASNDSYSNIIRNGISTILDIVNPVEFAYGISAQRIGIPGIPLLHMAYIENKTEDTITYIHAYGQNEGILKDVNGIKSFYKEALYNSGVIVLSLPDDKKNEMSQIMNEFVGAEYDEFSAVLLYFNRLFNTNVFKSTPDNKYNCIELIMQGLKNLNVLSNNQDITHLSPIDLIASGVVKVKMSSLLRTKKEREKKSKDLGL